MRYAVVIEKAAGSYSPYVPDVPGRVASLDSICRSETMVSLLAAYSSAPARRLDAPVARPLARAIAALGFAALVLAIGASSALAFSASFSWCQGSPRGSPEFQLKDVPAGTVNLKFAMTDLNKPSFHHGGGTVGYRGQLNVPCDAFSSGFVGPSPPPGQVHTYEFTIQALDASGKVLGATTARRTFPE